MKNVKAIAAAALCLAFPLQAFAAGAIAVDEELNVPSVSPVTGHATVRDAGKAAMDQCTETGNYSCKVAVRFEQCGAYAASWRFSSVGTGATKAEAIAMAQRDCPECTIVTAACETSSTSLVATSSTR